MAVHHHEETPGPSSGASVVLDIGGGNGALIVYTSEPMVGLEIELRPSYRAWDGTHTAVRQRTLTDTVRFAGVFGSLPAGDYLVRIKGDEVGPVLGMAVADGSVTELTWPHDPVG